MLGIRTIEIAMAATAKTADWELIARNRWIVAGHTLDLGLHVQLEKSSISTEC
jgi:hypothetical protein